MYRALGSLIESPVPQHERLAQALDLPGVPAASEHVREVTAQRLPYASAYLSAGAKPGGEVRDRVAGFRRALGLEQDAGAEADHLASLLSLLASLESWRLEEADPARQALLAQARDTLAWEYLVSWTGPYLASFARCGAVFYAEWAALLDRALGELCEEADLPSRLPEALRTAPPFPSPGRGAERATAEALSSPLRSGMIVLRDDLARLSSETGLAARPGGRRDVVRGFLEQDAKATLEWFAGHARRSARRTPDHPPRRIGQWWSERAARTADVLVEAAARLRMPAA